MSISFSCPFFRSQPFIFNPKMNISRHIHKLDYRKSQVHPLMRWDCFHMSGPLDCRKWAQRYSNLNGFQPNGSVQGTCYVTKSSFSPYSSRGNQNMWNFLRSDQLPNFQSVSPTCTCFHINRRERERDILKASVVFGLWWLHLKLHPQSSTHDEITDQIEGDQSTEW